MELFPADELKRKQFHLLMLAYIAAYWYLPRAAVLSVLGVLIVIVALGEFVRLRVPAFNRWILGFLGGVHREGEENRCSGLPWTLSGSFLTMLVFPDKRLVMVSFLYLAFGDTAAALFGKRFGRRKIFRGKTLEGTLACAAVCFLAGMIFLPWPLALVGAVAAAVIELIPWPLNDNFWMPLATTAMLMLFAKI